MTRRSGIDLFFSFLFFLHCFIRTVVSMNFQVFSLLSHLSRRFLETPSKISLSRVNLVDVWKRQGKKKIAKKKSKASRESWIARSFFWQARTTQEKEYTFCISWIHAAARPIHHTLWKFMENWRVNVCEMLAQKRLCYGDVYSWFFHSRLNAQAKLFIRLCTSYRNW